MGAEIPGSADFPIIFAPKRYVHGKTLNPLTRAAS
jgi:hypothetical protein